MVLQAGCELPAVGSRRVRALQLSAHGHTHQCNDHVGAACRCQVENKAHGHSGPMGCVFGKAGHEARAKTACDMNLLVKPLPQAVCRELRKPRAVCAALHHSLPLAASELGASLQAPGGLSCCREHEQDGADIWHATEPGKLSLWKERIKLRTSMM